MSKEQEKQYFDDEVDMFVVHIFDLLEDEGQEYANMYFQTENNRRYKRLDFEHHSFQEWDAAVRKGLEEQFYPE